jgi:hypothetical protein
MDDNGTKLLSKQQPPLPSNRILPECVDAEIYQLIEYGCKSEPPKFDDFDGTQRQE